MGLHPRGLAGGECRQAQAKVQCQPASPIDQECDAEKRQVPRP